MYVLHIYWFFHTYLSTSYFEQLIFYLIHISPLADFTYLSTNSHSFFYRYIKAYLIFPLVKIMTLTEMKVKLQFKNSSICYLSTFRVLNSLGSYMQFIVSKSGCNKRLQFCLQRSLITRNCRRGNSWFPFHNNTLHCFRSLRFGMLVVNFVLLWSSSSRIWWKLNLGYTARNLLIIRNWKYEILYLFSSILKRTNINLQPMMWSCSK